MNRREIIVAVGALGSQVVHAAAPERMKPQVDDVLVHAFGDKAGTAVASTDIGEDRLFSFPMSPEGVVRSGSLHNQVTLLRLDETSMTEKTSKYASGPFLAVSAACTHTGCEVSGWLPDTHELVCPCHGSRFDVLDGARVQQGPATKPLALLPIDYRDGVFRVAGKFSRRVGPAPTF